MCPDSSDIAGGGLFPVVPAGPVPGLSASDCTAAGCTGRCPAFRAASAPRTHMDAGGGLCCHPGPPAAHFVAALIGTALSAAGASYQAMFRNPMVSPDLLGASTGACFGAALAILLGASYAVITAGSFLFGLAAVGLTYLVGRLSRMRSNLAMVLAGVMVGSLFSAGTSFIKLVADTNEQLPEITYWLMGALTAVRLDDLHFAMVPILLGLLPLFFLRWRLNLLTISEAEARSMGVNTKLRGWLSSSARRLRLRPASPSAA